MRKLLILTCVIGIALQLDYYSELPEYVASNFGDGGRVNSWMSKGAHLAFGVTMYLFMTGLFLSVSWVFAKMPVKYISFPKKEYWLAEERREQMVPVMTNWLYFFGVATNAFILMVSHLVYSANLSEPPRLDMEPFFTLMIAYIVVMVVWLWQLYRKFNRVPEDS